MNNKKKGILITSIASSIYLISAIGFSIVSIGFQTPNFSVEEKVIYEEYNLKTGNGFFDSFHNYNIYKDRTFTSLEIKSFPKATQELINKKIDFFSWTNKLNIEYSSYLENQVDPFFPPGESKNQKINQLQNLIFINGNAIIFLLSSIIWFITTIGIVVGIFLIKKR